MKRTIMIIGGGMLQVPLIQTARYMGLQTIVTDYNPEAIGLKEADIPIVMSTRDIEGSVRVARTQNAITPIHAVVTAGTDASMTVAAVASALTLPGIKFEDAEAATNKIKMRTRFHEHGVPSPPFRPVWSLSDAKQACRELTFPLVMKPSDNMGARGVRRIDSLNDLSDAFHFSKQSSPSGELIIEEFMEGPELSIDAVIYEGDITITGVADRIISYAPYFIETGHTMPSQLDSKLVVDALTVMKKGIQALGIHTGAAKGDIKITPNGAMVGEIAARLSGGFMSTYTYPYATGVNLMKAVIEIALGQEPGNLEPLYNKVSIERAIILETGVITLLNNVDAARKIEFINDIILNIKPGDTIHAPRSNVEKAGHIIATADTLAQAEIAVEKCRNTLHIEVEKKPQLSLDIIQSAARDKLKKVCYVCKTCDGRDCPTGVPGMGGTGSGASFRQNIQSLQKYKIVTRVLHDTADPDTSSQFLSISLSFPVMPAPVTGTVTNMGGAMDELEYNRAVIKGANKADTIAFAGDGASPDKYKIGLQAISESGGHGIPVFKPRQDNKEILLRIKAAEDASVPAIGIDVDALSFKTMKMKQQKVGPKSVEVLKELISSMSVPLILKGIMSPYDAESALKAEADAIIISNHGGRVLDEMPGSMDMLADILAAVGSEIPVLIDGGFRTGVDVLKAIALGATGVLIGRPVTIAAVGKEEEGVLFYLRQIQQELRQAMLLTGLSTLAEADPSILKEVR